MSTLGHDAGSKHTSVSLLAYMVMLATEPDKLTDFIKDPNGAPARAGLSADDQAILTSGNQQLIYERLQSDATLKHQTDSK